MPLIGWLGLCPGALFAVLLALTDYPVLVQDAVGGARDAALFFAALVVGFGVLGIVAGALVSVGVDRVRPLWGAVGGVLAGVGMAVELLLGEAMPQPMGSIFLGCAAGVGLGLLGVAWATLFARRVAASSRLLLTCAMVAASLVLEGLCAFLGTIGARYFGLALLGCLAVATAGVLLAGRLAVSPEGGDLRRGEKAGLRGTLVPAGRSLSLWMFVGGLALPLAIRGFKWGEVLIGYPASAAFFGFERPLIGMLVAGAATVLVVRGTEAQLSRLALVLPLVAAALLLLVWLLPIDGSALAGRLVKNVAYETSLVIFAVGAWLALLAVVDAGNTPSIAFGFAGAFLCLVILACFGCSVLFPEAITSAITPCLVVLYLLVAAGVHVSGEAASTSGGGAGLEQACDQVVREYSLTAREAEVLVFLARGRTAVYMAEELDLSPHTVRAYIKNVYKKLGVDGKEGVMSFMDDRLGGR